MDTQIAAPAGRGVVLTASAVVVAISTVVSLSGGLAPILAVRAVPATAFVVASAVVWQRAGNRRIGLLLAGCGVLFASPGLGLAPGEAAAVYREASGGYAPFGAMLAHLLLAYPSGRLRTLFDRTAVVGIDLLAAAYCAQQLLVGDDKGMRFCAPYACPTLPVLVRSEVAAHVLPAVTSGLYGALIIAVLVVLVRRGVTGSARQREQQRPVLVASLAGGALGLFEAVSRALPVPLPHWVGVAVPILTSVGVAGMPAVLVVIGLRARLVAFGIGDLVDRSGDRVTPSNISELLPRVLGDPAAKLVPNNPAVPLSPGLAATPIGDPQLALLVYSSDPPPDSRLLKITIDTLALVLGNARLEQRLRDQLMQVDQSRARIVEAADTERLRIERDLHDGAQQHLVATALGVQLARQRLRDDPAGAESLLAEVEDRLRETLKDIRDLARGIHPAVLTEYGLGAAVEALRDQVPLDLEISDELTSRPVESVERAAYFVVCESLVNVVKHAQVNAARVDFWMQGDCAHVSISDQGVGGANARIGSGLRGLADRVAAAGGTLSVESTDLGGTRVTAALPLAGHP